MNNVVVVTYDIRIQGEQTETLATGNSKKGRNEKKEMRRDITLAVLLTMISDIHVRNHHTNDQPTHCGTTKTTSATNNITTTSQRRRLHTHYSMPQFIEQE